MTNDATLPQVTLLRRLCVERQLPRGQRSYIFSKLQTTGYTVMEAATAIQYLRKLPYRKV